ncbi:MAG: hypothetical protein S4CHLAM45_13180 [Chlamydiales bacterium]|nr:hypothetical protein [Chlamydiales bacterium]MCH9619807.1 hypothetical protein [Chlamydiales bacterium]MCH9623413.1 hypothetical protein [Chlamydiales bacterium]
MKLVSPVFEEGATIPRKYTCQGDDTIPPLTISDVPSAAKSLALIVDDPDVPESVRADRMWVHWVVFNIEPSITAIEEGKEPLGVAGQNSGGANVYMGPCPPDCEHRYFFKLYALDCKLSLGVGTTKEELLRAIKGHLIEKTELMGRYCKT